MPARRVYVDLKVPEDLMDAVDRLIARGGLGYRNRSEFAIDAVRRRVEELSGKPSGKAS